MKEKYLKSLIVIVVVSLMGIFIYQNINKENKPLPEVKLKKIVNKNKSFAIMIQEKSETDKYQEYDSNTWPGDDYKFKEAKCIDNNGNEIKEAVTYEESKITLTTNKTVYCTVYFDKSLIGKLREADTNKNLSTDIQGDMYRYQGTDDVHNWICFGTTNNCGTNETDNDGDSIPDGIDKYMYRIIGVTKEGQLKLIKETFLKEDNKIIPLQWNNVAKISQPYTGVDNDKCDGTNCDWPNSMLFKRLNGLNNDETTKGNKGNSEIFIDSEYYNYLKSGDGSGLDNTTPSTWYNIIENHNWKYGDIFDSVWDAIPHNAASYDGDAAYAIESGESNTQRVWPKIGQSCNNETPCELEDYTWKNNNVEAKIGLMYLHDYYYAYYDGKTESTRGKPGNSGVLNNCWITYYKDGFIKQNNGDSEFLITRRGITKNNPNIGSFLISTWAYVTTDSIYIEIGTSIYSRPVFYLTNTIDLSGNGTKENPFIIDIE